MQHDDDHRGGDETHFFWRGDFVALVTEPTAVYGYVAGRLDLDGTYQIAVQADGFRVRAVPHGDLVRWRLPSH